MAGAPVARPPGGGRPLGSQGQAWREDVLCGERCSPGSRLPFRLGGSGCCKYRLKQVPTERGDTGRGSTVPPWVWKARGGQLGERATTPQRRVWKGRVPAASSVSGCGQARRLHRRQALRPLFAQGGAHAVCTRPQGMRGPWAGRGANIRPRSLPPGPCPKSAEVAFSTPLL